MLWPSHDLTVLHRMNVVIDICTYVYVCAQNQFSSVTCSGCFAVEGVFHERIVFDVGPAVFWGSFLHVGQEQVECCTPSVV